MKNFLKTHFDGHKPTHFKEDEPLQPQILRAYNHCGEIGQDIIVALCKEIVLLEGLNDGLEADITHLLS